MKSVKRILPLPKPARTQLVELLLNVADEAKDLRVRIDQRSSNHHQAARTGAPHAAPLIHQDRRIPERFRDQNRLAFTEVEMEGTAKGSHLRGDGRLGDGGPVSESGFDSLRDRIIRAPHPLDRTCHRKHNMNWMACAVEITDELTSTNCERTGG